MHDRVNRVESNIDVDGSIIAHIDTGLPNRWRARGWSDNGVLAIEPVRFQFSDSYPFVAPDVALRFDFDRSHPHLLPGKSSDLPRPCYFEGSPRDLLRMRGPHGIVDQLVDWLEKAASTTLIDPSQGWEPARRDHIDDHISVDPDRIRAHVTNSGGGQFYLAPYGILGKTSSQHCYCTHFLNEMKLGSDTIDLLYQRFGQAGIGIIVWSGRSQSGGLLIADKYRPESVSNVGELFLHARALGMGEQLRTKFNLICQRLKTRTSNGVVLVSVLLLARRPFNIIGQSSHIEILPYIIEVAVPSDLEDDSARPVRLACQRNVISKALLKKMAGSVYSGERPWTLLGAGSVGSKLSLHLAREGLAPAIVVDTGFLHPHNFARHAILPFGRGEGIQDIKAQALIDAIGQLGQKSVGSFRDIVELCTSAPNSEQTKIWPKGTGLIVDATGSPTVTDALCLPEVARSRPRAVETCLMGEGRVGYLSLEGPSCNPSLQDLVAEAYRVLAHDETLSDVALGGKGTRVEIGQGCSTLTAQMSDAILSATIPTMAVQVSKLLRHGLSASGGELLIGQTDNDLLSQNWQRHSVVPFIIVQGADLTTPSVRVSARVRDVIDDAIAKKSNVETGGVLVGRFNETTNTFHVVDTIEPPPDSEFSRSLFVLGIDGLSEAIQNYIDKTHGALFPVGTWHNHLGDSPASNTDLVTGLQIAFAQTFPALLLIRTATRFRGLVIETLSGAMAQTSSNAKVELIEEVR